MSRITIYSKPHCPYCVLAKELLDLKKVEYTEIDLIKDIDKKDEMIKKSGRMTVPQIFIGDKHIGGYDNLKELEDKGELEKMIKD
jgi:glutaredoxin 3